MLLISVDVKCSCAVKGAESKACALLNYLFGAFGQPPTACRRVVAGPLFSDSPDQNGNAALQGRGVWSSAVQGCLVSLEDPTRVLCLGSHGGPRGGVFRWARYPCREVVARPAFPSGSKSHLYLIVPTLMSFNACSSERSLHVTGGIHVVDWNQLIYDTGQTLAQGTTKQQTQRNREDITGAHRPGRKRFSCVF